MRHIMTFTPHLGLRQRKPRVALLINRDSSGTVFPISFSHIINNILFLTNYFFFFLATIAIITTAATATAAILHTIIGKRSVFCSGVSTVTFVGVEAAASVFSAVEEGVGVDAGVGVAVGAEGVTEGSLIKSAFPHKALSGVSQSLCKPSN